MNTNNPKLILISGPPAAGKTTLSKKIVERFALPFFGSDAIKEIILDDLHWEKLSLETLDNIGKTSFELFYYVLESFFKSSAVFVAEANLHPRWANKRVKELIMKNNVEVFYIYCKADMDVVKKRFIERAALDSRHSGLRDKEKMKDNEFIERVFDSNQPLEIGVDVFEFDTTDFEKINHEKLFEEIDNFLKK